MDYSLICDKVREVAIATGDFIRKEVDKIKADGVEVKGKHNFVTYVDKTAEGLIISALEQLVPGAGYIAEENTKNKHGEVYNWVIDPLDGTTNFIHGLPPFCISIGLMENDEVVVGVIYEVVHDECFYAYKGGKSYLNGKVIHVTDSAKVDDSLIATGFPYVVEGRMQPFMRTFEYFMLHSHGVRRLGSAAADLAYLACGRFDGFYEYALHPWDVAAGVIIVTQAGGKLSDFKGGSDFIFGKEILASNGIIHEELRNIVHSNMKDIV
jgi:myo-inositol-1(or 4)-monophosphatase